MAFLRVPDTTRKSVTTGFEERGENGAEGLLLAKHAAEGQVCGKFSRSVRDSYQHSQENSYPDVHHRRTQAHVPKTVPQELQVTRTSVRRAPAVLSSVCRRHAV